MRAAVYAGQGGPDVIALREVDTPQCGSDEILVKVAYAGLNRADLLERSGRYVAPERPAGAPVVGGLEFAGVVHVLGRNVTTLALGDRVCGLVPVGAHAEFLCTHALTVAHVPDGVDLTQAAAIPEAFITAHDALFSLGRLAFGDVALVHAIGSSVGLAALALAKAAGATVLGTSRTADKLRRAQVHGLDHGVLLDDRWPAAVRTEIGPRGVDVLIDFLGATAFDRNVGVLAPRGRIVLVGTLGGTRGEINTGAFMGKRASLIGTVLRSRGLDERIALARDFQRRLLPRFQSGELQATIDRIFPLGQLADAHGYMEQNRNFGKILIAIEPQAATLKR